MDDFTGERDGRTVSLRCGRSEHLLLREFLFYLLICYPQLIFFEESAIKDEPVDNGLELS